MVTAFTTPGVYIEEVPAGIRTIQPAPTGVCAFVGHAADGPVHEPVALDHWAAFERRFGGHAASMTLGLAVQLFFANGGQQALVVRLPPGATAQTAWVPRTKAARQRREGLYALDGSDFNLLCLPPPAAGRDFSISTWSRAATYCRQHRAVLLMDAPTVWHDLATTRQGMLALQTTISPAAATHVAVYQPRLRMNDPSQAGADLLVAPGGAVAGVVARTDAQRGVWTAPAGTGAALAPVQRLEPLPSAADIEQLNAEGLNSLRTLPGRGTMVWGARTLAGADATGSEWKYLPVKRLALHIEDSVRRGSTWVVFEPNGEPLWTQLRASIEAFLLAIWRQGGLRGQKPEQAFFVRCDRSTMSAADIATGTVRVAVGFAPLKPAEFVLLRLVLQAA